MFLEAQKPTLFDPEVSVSNIMLFSHPPRETFECGYHSAVAQVDPNREGFAVIEMCPGMRVDLTLAFAELFPEATQDEVNVLSQLVGGRTSGLDGHYYTEEYGFGLGDGFKNKKKGPTIKVDIDTESGDLIFNSLLLEPKITNVWSLVMAFNKNIVGEAQGVQELLYPPTIEETATPIGATIPAGNIETPADSQAPVAVVKEPESKNDPKTGVLVATVAFLGTLATAVVVLYKKTTKNTDTTNGTKDLGYTYREEPTTRKGGTLPVGNTVGSDNSNNKDKVAAAQDGYLNIKYRAEQIISEAGLKYAQGKNALKGLDLINKMGGGHDLLHKTPWRVYEPHARRVAGNQARTNGEIYHQAKAILSEARETMNEIYRSEGESSSGGTSSSGSTSDNYGCW